MHRPAVEFDQMAHNCQTKAKPGHLAIGTGFALTKAVENERQKIWLDPNPIVADDDFDVRIDSLRQDTNPAAFSE
jgi:hypothetical protein